jgi:hypothetical protein
VDVAAGTLGRREALALSTVLLVLWLTAGVLWWSAQWHADAYATMAADLPLLTARFVAFTRGGGAFAAAALLSAAILHLFWRPGPSPLLRAVWLLCIALALGGVAVIALTLPMTNFCGDLLPPSRDGPAAGAAADAQGTGDCRGID